MIYVSEINIFTYVTGCCSTRLQGRDYKNRFINKEVFSILKGKVGHFSFLSKELQSLVRNSAYPRGIKLKKIIANKQTKQKRPANKPGLKVLLTTISSGGVNVTLCKDFDLTSFGKSLRFYGQDLTVKCTDLRKETI